MKIDKVRIANASALAMTIIWLLCAAIVWLLPGFSIMMTSSWMHGMNMSALGMWRLTLGNFLSGGIGAVVSTWVVGYIFAWSLEKTSN